MLVREHPDFCRLKFKFGRWHHEYINKNKLKKYPILLKKKDWKSYRGNNQLKLVKSC